MTERTALVTDAGLFVAPAGIARLRHGGLRITFAMIATIFLHSCKSVEASSPEERAPSIASSDDRPAYYSIDWSKRRGGTVDAPQRWDLPEAECRSRLRLLIKDGEWAAEAGTVPLNVRVREYRWDRINRDEQVDAVKLLECLLYTVAHVPPDILVTNERGLMLAAFASGKIVFFTP